MKYRIVENKEFINNEIVRVYSVVNTGGVTENCCHFTDIIDAEYIKSLLDAKRIWGDDISYNAKMRESWLDA